MDVKRNQREAKDMAKLTNLKCKDCIHYKLTGWWDMSKTCEISGFPVDRDDGACISVSPRK